MDFIDVYRLNCYNELYSNKAKKKTLSGLNATQCGGYKSSGLDKSLFELIV